MLLKMFLNVMFKTKKTIQGKVCPFVNAMTFVTESHIRREKFYIYILSKVVLRIQSVCLIHTIPTNVQQDQ